MLSILKTAIPSWTKYLVAGLLVVAVWSFGYVKGLDHAYDRVVKETVVVYQKAQKVSEQVIKNEAPKSQQLKQKGEKLKQEGQAYEIQFPDDTYTFNDEFVRLFNNSLSTDLSSLSSGDNGSTK